jgi:hypothetical protein
VKKDGFKFKMHVVMVGCGASAAAACCFCCFFGISIYECGSYVCTARFCLICCDAVVAFSFPFFLQLPVCVRIIR